MSIKTNQQGPLYPADNLCHSQKAALDVDVLIERYKRLIPLRGSSRRYLVFFSSIMEESSLYRLISRVKNAITLSCSKVLDLLRGWDFC